MNAVTKSGQATTAAPVRCPSCEMRFWCFGQGADASALGQLDAAVKRRVHLEGGEQLYRTGDPFHSLYAVRTGCLMNSMRDPKGQEHVMGFHIMGDVVGVGGIGQSVYVFDMRALEPSDVCEIPYDRLQALGSAVPALGRNIFRIFGRYRNRDARMLSLRREDAAEARLAGFLLDFLQRLEERGGDPARFRLPMSRAELANYLGLGVADVEVEIARLDTRGTVMASGQRMEIRDLEGLQSLAAGRG